MPLRSRVTPPGKNFAPNSLPPDLQNLTTARLPSTALTRAPVILIRDCINNATNDEPTAVARILLGTRYDLCSEAAPRAPTGPPAGRFCDLAAVRPAPACEKAASASPARLGLCR